MREEMGLVRTSKLTIGANDSLHKVANKMAAYAYKNSDEPNSDDVKNALTAKIIGQGFENIERMESHDTIKYITEFCRLSGKLPDDMSEYKGFLFKAVKDDKDVLILADHSLPWSRHNLGWVRKRGGDIIEGFRIVYNFKLDKLVGHDKINRSLIDDFYASELPSETTKDVERFAREYQKFTDPDYNKRGRYYTYYDEVLMEVGHDLINQDFKALREKGWAVELGEAEEYYEWDQGEREVKTRPSGYIVTKLDAYGEPTGAERHYDHMSLRNYEKYGGHMPYMKFFDQTLRHLYQDELNVQAMERYAKERSSDVASAWQTKKNIPEATLKAMENTTFKQDFDFVEFDEGVDLKLLPRLETEWAVFREVLPQLDGQPDLRFRLLGKHRAAGIFVPMLNSIGIDPREERINSEGATVKINGMTSLAHEYAHFLDYNAGKDGYPLSLQNDFRGVLEQYQKNLNDLPSNHPYKKTNSKFGLDYFKTPTEVFARSFELYISNFENVKSAFVQDHEAFKRVEYEAFNGSEQEISNYFKEQFPEMEQALKNFQASDMSFLEEQFETTTTSEYVEVQSDQYVSADLIDDERAEKGRYKQGQLELGI